MKVKNICFEQLNIIHQSISKIDESNVLKVIELISSCSGILYFTGIGKNGHVAAKTASTFASIGIRSLFLNPVDAVHGDMGNIRQEDLVFAISKSANTEELYVFLYNLKQNNPNIKVIFLHSNSDGKCLNLTDVNIYVPIEKEIDKFNIVPTTSISAYTIFLQSLGIHISEIQNFSLIQFKKNHPGGNIGKILKSF